MELIESFNILVGLRYAVLYLLLVITIYLLVVIVLLPRSYRLGIFSEFLLGINSAYRNSSLFHRLGRVLGDKKQPKGLPILEPYEVVSVRCIRILGLNPGSHTLQGTNTYLIGTSSNKILIDTGEDITSKAYVSFLLDVVFKNTNTEQLSDILLTHGHGDHQGGVSLLLKEFKRRNIPLPRIHKCNIVNGMYPCTAFKSEHIKDQQIFKCKGATLRAIHTPGHTDDHMSFMLLEDKAILSGDSVLGCGTTVFDNLKQYMDSLHHLKSIITKESVSLIYPGHGPVIKDALGKVTDYIRHRQFREDEIVSILKTNDKRWYSSYELVDLVYGKENLSFFVKFSAQYNISHVLNKLKEENKVNYKTATGLYKFN